jgi:DNA-binding CsgD family transcriptional regulator/PAS domain-containing protein
MHDLDKFSSLIGRVYDAALDDSLWVEVIHRLVDFVGGSAGALFSKDAMNNRGNIYYESGTDPHWVKIYFDRCVAIDPTTVVQFFAEVGQLVSITDIMPYSEFVQTRFYDEWVQPQGLSDCLNTILDKTATTVSMFCVFRTVEQGPVDDAMRARMELIVPHVRRAVLISRLFERTESQVEIFSDLLDGIEVGVFLLDSSGQIAHANAAGQKMLRAGTLLREIGGRVYANDPQADSLLLQSFLSSAKGDVALGSQGIAIPLLSRDGEQYIGHVLPLNSDGRRKASSGDRGVVAALFVHKASIDDPLPPQIIRQVYNLTPTELRVLMAIVDVGGIPEVASALGIAVTTVKTHLSRLYEKMGVNRQADLVKLFASYTTPLRVRS